MFSKQRTFHECRLCQKKHYKPPLCVSRYIEYSLHYLIIQRLYTVEFAGNYSEDERSPGFYRYKDPNSGFADDDFYGPVHRSVPILNRYSHIGVD